MSPLGTTEHRERCVLSRLNQASELCQINPEAGLDYYQKIIDEDDRIINEIIRRHGHVGGEL